MTKPDFLNFVQERRAALIDAINADLEEVKACDATIEALSGAQPEPEPEPNPEPEPEPVPGPTPTPVPAPVPAPGGPCGSRTLGRDIRNCRDPGVVVTASDVTITQALATFDDWDIGIRRLIFRARIGRTFDIRSVGGTSGSMPLIQCMPGGGFDEAEFMTVLDTAGSMSFKQEKGGVAGVIRAWDLRGMSQDALKVSGGNLIEKCRIADAFYRGGAPHSDALTCMSADAGVIFRDNDVDWNYANTPSQAGINNWFRIESYAAGSNAWDDIIIEGNRLRHANDRSFGMQVVMKNAPVWRGSIKVRNNVMEKAGGSKKILYAPSSHISEWSGNVDGSGADIPLSAA